MEASALQRTGRLPALAGISPYLRLQSDERLIAFVRRGHSGAFDALMRRYQARLLAFCRHMLSSNEDAEDILQEVFAAAYTAIRADDRPIHARAWLYRIARNRCLNHLRRPVPVGQESMDVFERSDGASAADTAHRREEFRLIVADVHTLPEGQRTALLLRQIEGLTYEQIAETMDVTVASVKSLLVRARMSLAGASEARLVSCAEARLELGQVAEGVVKSSPQVRRHVKSCVTCREFKRELRRTGRAVAAVLPLGPIAVLKGMFAANATGGASGGSASGVMSAVAGSAAAKAATGVVAAALVTVGASEVRQDDRRDGREAGTVAAADDPDSARSASERPLADTTRAAAMADRPNHEPRTTRAQSEAPERGASQARAEAPPEEPPPPEAPAGSEPAPEPLPPAVEPAPGEPPTGTDEGDGEVDPSTNPPVDEEPPTETEPVTEPLSLSPAGGRSGDRR